MAGLCLFAVVLIKFLISVAVCPMSLPPKKLMERINTRSAKNQKFLIVMRVLGSSGEGECEVPDVKGLVSYSSSSRTPEAKLAAFGVSKSGWWWYPCVLMTPAERDRMNLLSTLIQRERDYKKYIEYVKQINEIMAQKEKRLAEAQCGDGAKSQ